MSETRVHEVRKEETTDSSSTEEDELFIGEITTTTAKNVLITNLKVNGKFQNRHWRSVQCATRGNFRRN
jgi:alpha-acetolactate decarboxylase